MGPNAQKRGSDGTCEVLWGAEGAMAHSGWQQDCPGPRFALWVLPLLGTKQVCVEWLYLPSWGNDLGFETRTQEVRRAWDLPTVLGADALEAKNGSLGPSES